MFSLHWSQFHEIQNHVATLYLTLGIILLLPRLLSSHVHDKIRFIKLINKLNKLDSNAHETMDCAQSFLEEDDLQAHTLHNKSFLNTESLSFIKRSTSVNTPSFYSLFATESAHPLLLPKTLERTHQRRPPHALASQQSPSTQNGSVHVKAHTPWHCLCTL